MSISTKIRVLQVLSTMNRGGGIESWVMDIFRHYDRKQMHMDYCFTGEGPGNFAGEIREVGAQILHCPLGLNYICFIKQFTKLLVKGDYDVVHSHLHNLSGPVIHAAKKSGIPVRIAHFYSTREGHRNDWKRRLYLIPLRRWIRKEATHILGCSQAVLKAFWPDMCHSGDQRLDVIYIGIDFERFRRYTDRRAVRKELGLPSEAYVVGHVGRFYPMKNQAAFVRIAAKVASKVPNTYFLLAGDGPLRQQVESLAQDLGIRDRVLFTGYYEDIPKLLRAMDVFLFPSLWEGFGNVVTEAIVAGVPVVVSDEVPAVREIGIGPFKRLAFPVANEDLAAQNVIKLLENPEIGRKMIAECDQELKVFRIENNLQLLQAVYFSGNR